MNGFFGNGNCGNGCGGFGGSNNCCWIIILLLLCNCGDGMCQGCDCCTLILLILILNCLCGCGNQHNC